MYMASTHILKQAWSVPPHLRSGTVQLLVTVEQLRARLQRAHVHLHLVWTSLSSGFALKLSSMCSVQIQIPFFFLGLRVLVPNAVRFVSRSKAERQF